MSKPSSSSLGDARSSSSSSSSSLLSKNPSSHDSNDNMATTASAIFPHGYENRNAEEVHIRALAAARIKHDQVRQQALAVLEINQLQEETARLQALRFEQEKRIKANQVRDEEQQKIRQLKEREERQARLAKEEEELRNKEAKERIDALLQSAENKARNTTTPPIQSSTSESAPRNGTISFTGQQQASAPIPSSSKDGVIGFSGPPSSAPLTSASNTAPAFTLQLVTQPLQSNQQPSIKGKEPAMQQQTPNAAPAASSAHANTTLANGHSSVHHVLPHVERYAEIHKSLKEVRNYFKPGGNAPVELRKIANDRRREITKFMGQLVAVGDKSGNLIAVSLLVELP
jgi:nucleoporin GLE1